MNNIKWLCADNNKFMSEVAKDLGISKVTFAGYCNGSVQLTEKVIRILRDYFQVTADFLLGYSDYGIFLYSAEAGRQIVTGTWYREHRLEVKSFIVSAGKPRTVVIHGTEIRVGGKKVYREVVR